MYIVPEGVPGLTPGTYTDEAAARAASQTPSTSGNLSSTLTPSQQFEMAQQNAYNQAYSQTGVGVAQSALTGLQNSYNTMAIPDLAKVFQDYADKLGLGDISKQIAALTTQSNTQQRTLEDLPDTIRSSTRDVGLSGALLDRRVAGESRPIIRNIADLLQRVSVLGNQYNQGLQQAQYSTQLVGENFQNQRSVLNDRIGFAQNDLANKESLFNSLLSSLSSGIETPQQAAARALQEKTLAQDESQFSRSLAEQQRQFNLTRHGGSGGGGSSSGQPTLAQLKAANELALAYGLNPSKFDESQQTAFSQAIAFYPGNRAAQDKYLSGLGITPATIRAGSGGSWLQNAWTKRVPQSTLTNTVNNWLRGWHW